MTEQIETALYAAYMVGAAKGIERLNEFRPEDMFMLSGATEFVCDVLEVIEGKSTIAN